MATVDLAESRGGAVAGEGRQVSANPWGPVYEVGRDSGSRAYPSPVFVILSFEGPDDYARAGGLGARVAGLTCALAEAGFETHLFFIGGPDAEGHEITCDGRLHLHRWCQWISRYHPGGVYDGEERKLDDWNRSLPPWLEANLLSPCATAGRSVVVIGEEWQTSATITRLGARASEAKWGGLVRFFWNANNTFGFERVPWQALRESATVTTVSRFMKHEMWRLGVDARVLPNGIAAQWLSPCDQHAVDTLRRAAEDRLLLAKIARWDPDKRWLMAVDAVLDMKKRGLRPLLVARGGVEPHGIEVARHAEAAGLVTRALTCEDDSPSALCRAVAAANGSDVVMLQSRLSQAQLQCLYRASDAVLANSGIEPFGLVGLEAMASGGVAFLGATGEDYASPGHDAISLQTSRADEITSNVLRLLQRPELAHRLRHEAKTTGARYTWARVIHTHLLPMLA